MFLTWDLELSIQQSASMVTPEKQTGKARAISGRGETSLDDYGIPRDCVVGSPPSRYHMSYIQSMTKHTVLSDWAVVSENNGDSTPLHRVR